MTPEELIVALFETVTEHLKLPEGFEWAPLASVAALGIFGLVLMIRGAKWAPALASIAFLALGGVLGSGLAQAVGTPLWPTVGVVGVLSLILGLVMFRFWQAVLLATCFMVAGLSVYYVRVLTPEVQNWISAGPQAGAITLPEAGTVVGDTRNSALTTLKSLWTHLDQNVADFSPTIITLLLATGIAGLVFGLLLPGVSRSLWASSLGTFLFGIGITGVLSIFTPGALEWLRTNHGSAWSIVALVWLFSLVINLRTCRRQKKTAADEDPSGTDGSPALA